MTEDGGSYSSHRTTDSPLQTLSTPTSRLEQQPGMPQVGSFTTIIIDFILTPQRFKSGINTANAWCISGADTGSDHDLVLTSIKLKLKTKRFTESYRNRFDQEKRKDPKLGEVFQAKVSE